MGKSGSGKSLLLRSIALLEPWDSGTIRWQEREIAGQSACRYRGEVIYVHQRAAPFEGSVEDILRRPFELRAHRDKSYDRAWILARLSEVDRDERFLSQTHDQLSGGEGQLVAVLRAIQLAPQVLLLDEPTSALDPQSVRQVEQLIQDWFDGDAKRRALVWVSHDLSQTMRVCDQVRFMRDGQIHAEGDAS